MPSTHRASDFSDFGGWTFINCAFHGPLPRVAEEALQIAVELRRNPSLIRTEYHFTFPDAYRREIGRLVGAAPSAVSLVDSATAGSAILANGLDWRDGDEVVIPAGEFPSNRLPWQQLARRGVRLVEVGLGTGPDREQRLIEALTPRTRILQVSWVSFTDGRRLDLAPLSDACWARGILFVVDGSQGIGGLPFDLRVTWCDVLIGVGYKWLLGPYGLGYVVIQPELAERLDVGNVNWFATNKSEDFNRLADLALGPRAGAMRFDMNETANFFNVAAGIAAVRYINTVTPAAIEVHAQGLIAHLTAGLPEGYTPMSAGDRLRSNIFCFKGPSEDATARKHASLRRQRIAISSREGALRVSPHIYNTRDDIDRLLAALRAPDDDDDDSGPIAESSNLSHRVAELLGG
jgi:cysteine desulfurase / selenocysteine lyase